MAFSQGEGIGPFVPILAITVVAALLMAVGRSSSRVVHARRRPDRRRHAGQRHRPPVPRRRLVRRCGGRLHRRPVVAGVQPRRRRHRRRRRPAPAHLAAGAVIAETFPAALDGERLDRVVALLADVSRVVVAAELIAGGAVHVDGEVAPSGKVRLDGRRPRGDRHRGDPGCSCPQGGRRRRVRRRPRRRRRGRRRQAGRTGRPSRRRQSRRHPGQRPARPISRTSPGSAATDRPGIVHRLDAGSSGLLVVARTAAASASLIAQFAAHTAGRRYVALVWGHPAAAHGIVDAPIGRDPSDPTKMAVVADGRPARTEYEVVEEFRGAGRRALLTCRLETGRTHQIRVHLAAVGHPLVGDSVYGPGARRSDSPARSSTPPS